MKVVVVTGFTPTPENTRGISGLLYAILRYRPKNVEVKIFTFNNNRIEDGEIKNVSMRVKDRELVITIEANSSLALEKGLFKKNADYFEQIFSIKPVLRENK